jgi:hypothetical protein
MGVNSQIPYTHLTRKKKQGVCHTVVVALPFTLKMSPKPNVIGSFSFFFLVRDAKIVWACKNGSKFIGYEGMN